MSVADRGAVAVAPDGVTSSMDSLNPALGERETQVLDRDGFPFRKVVHDLGDHVQRGLDLVTRTCMPNRPKQRHQQPEIRLGIPCDQRSHPRARASVTGHN